MGVRPEEGDRLPDSDELPRLQEALDATTTRHPGVLAWLAEAQRLFAEAEERFESGRILSALSSLAAVPPLHHRLTERFSGLLLTAESSESDDADIATGLYL
jgi:hypothetical protein